MNIKFIGRSTLAAIIVLACTNSLHAAVNSVHTKESNHNLDTDVWTSSTLWTGGSGTSANANLTADFTFLDADVASNVMFDFQSMDGSMNMISHYTQDALNYSNVQVRRSDLGTPATLNFTIESEEVAAPDGFRMVLNQPVSFDLQFSHFEPTAIANLQTAIYTGSLPAKSWTITDPNLGPGSTVYTGDGNGEIEFGILVEVPEPSSIALLAIALLAVGYRSGRIPLSTECKQISNRNSTLGCVPKI